MAKVKKQTKLQAAEARILLLEDERTFLRENAMKQHEIIEGMKRALVPFAFIKEPEQFQGRENNLTPCMVKDSHVQQARAIIRGY